jgi:hypothetical protein
MTSHRWGKAILNRVAFAAEYIESLLRHMATVRNPDDNAITLRKLKRAEEQA